MNFYCPSSISNSTNDYCIGKNIIYSVRNFPFGLNTTILLLIGIILIILYSIFILPLWFKEKKK